MRELRQPVECQRVAFAEASQEAKADEPSTNTIVRNNAELSHQRSR
jgi:hypothetical protein